MDTVKLRILEGGLCDVPIYEDHSRGRNWCATVTANPTAPGGMDRNFWPRARKNNALFFYVVPPELHTPCVIEFGADYVAFSGRKHPKRWHGVLVEVTRTELVLTACSGAREAFDLCNELLLELEAARAQPLLPKPFVSAAPATDPLERQAAVVSPPSAGPQTED